MTDFVTTFHGTKAHLRDPGFKWATRCGRPVYGLADAIQVRANPHLICSTCSQSEKLSIPGHRLTMEWNGEYGAESSSTGTCPCGWSESGSSQKVVKQEYRWHLERVLERMQAERTPKQVTQ